MQSQKKKFLYNLVSIDTMNTQINVRFPEGLLSSARDYALKHGFGTVQEFIKDAVREKIFDEPSLTKKELALVRKIVHKSEKGNLYGTEKELFKKLR